MNVRTLIRLLAAGRTLVGAALIAAPTRTTTGWVGSVAGEPGAQVLTRALGVRDLALGAGALAALRDGSDAEVRRWVAAGVASDAVDAAASLLAADDRPGQQTAAVVAIAAGAAVVGIAAIARLGR